MKSPTRPTLSSVFLCFFLIAAALPAQTFTPTQFAVLPSLSGLTTDGAPVSLPDPTPPALSAAVDQSFDGLGANGVLPPDSNIAVGVMGGNTLILQTVHSRVAVFDHFGNVVAGPFALTTLWNTALGAGNGCPATDTGDVIAQYDTQMKRWLIAQFGSLTTPALQCIAVSQTNDPTGAYNVYSYNFGPMAIGNSKFGVWPTATNSAYFAAMNLGDTKFGPAGSLLCAYDRSKMSSANAAKAGTTAALCKAIPDDTPSGQYFVPADFDGTLLPPAASPGYFLALETEGSQALRIFKATPDFTANTFTVATEPDILVNPFDEACDGFACIPQVGATQLLDSLGYRPMYRLAYRVLAGGATEALVVTHSVTIGAGPQTGTRWYELTQAFGVGPFTIAQSGDYAPDAAYRWMGSMAMDNNGDIAIGYSKSSPTQHPAIWFTGQVAGDPPNTLRAENEIIEGGGSQTANTFWGQYTSMRVDPKDDCTFWYTNQYQPVDGTINWNTRIAAFRLGPCPATKSFAITANPVPLTLTMAAGTSTITVTSRNGFNGNANPISLSVSNCPPGATCMLSVSPVMFPAGGSGTSILTITPGASTPAGTYQVMVQSMNGAVLGPFATVVVTIVAPDFTISASPSTLSLGQGSSGSSTLTLTAVNGFNSLVTFAVTGCPANVTCPNPASVTPTTTGVTTQMTVNTGVAATPGSYPLTVTASGPGNIPQHATTVTLNVLIGTTTTVGLIAPEPTFVGQQYSVAYTVTAVSGTPTGNVTVSDGINTNTCTVAAATCPLVSITPGVKTITVTYLGNATFGSSSGTGSHTVNPINIVIPAGLTAPLGQPIPLLVTLSAPAPAAVVLIFSSSNPEQMTISPSSVFIAQGATAPVNPPLLTGLDFGAPTLTVSAFGYQTVNQPVQVTATANLFPKTLTLKPGAVQSLNLILSGSPPSGLTVMLSSSGASATVPATVSIPPNSNFVSIPVTAVSPGVATIHASALPAVQDTTATITVTQPLAITPTPLPSGQVNIFYSQQLMATGGTGPYTWSLTAGTLPTLLGLNASSGVVSGTPNIAVTNTPLTFMVTDSSFPVQTASMGFTLTITPAGSAATITATGGVTQSVHINSPFVAFQATVKDAMSNPVNGALVTFAAPGSGPSGSFAGGVNTAITVNGVATSNIFTANSIAGAYTVMASVPGAATPATFFLTNTPGPAANIQVVSGSGQKTGVGTSFGAALVAFVTDSGGNAVSGANVTFTAVPAGSGASATLGGLGSAMAPTLANGQASSPIPLANAIAGVYSVTATTPGAPTPATFTLTNRGPAANIVVSSGSGQTASINSAFAHPLVALVTDTGGTGVQGVAVTFTPPTSGPSGTFSPSNTVMTDANGLATSGTFTANGAAGSYTVNASFTGSALAPFSLTNAAGIVTPASLTVSPGATIPFIVSLASTHTQPVIITLTSSDTSKLTVSPNFIYIAPGSLTPDSPPLITGVATGPATITASSFNFASVNTQVQVAYTMTFFPINPAVNAGSSTNLVLLLSAPAPAAGLIVSLGSTTGAATVPLSVTIPGGSTSVFVPVTGVATGTPTISASATGALPASVILTVH